MAKTYYLDHVLLNHVLRGTPYESPSAVYLALYTVAPTESGGGTEVAGGGYTRQTVTFGVPSQGSVTNAADVVFPLATAAWGTVVAFAILDAPTGGNILYFANLTAAREILASDQLRFPVGQVIVQEG